MSKLATLVSHRMPFLASYLERGIAIVTGGIHVDYMLIVFTPERLNYISSIQSTESLIRETQRLLTQHSTEMPPGTTERVNACPASLPIARATQDLATGIELALTELAGERIPFTLLLFPPEIVSYASTAEREDSMQQIRDMLAGWQGGMPHIPAHEVN